MSQQQQLPESPGSITSEASWPEPSGLLPGVVPLSPSSEQHQQQQRPNPPAHPGQPTVHAAVGRGPAYSIALPVGRSALLAAPPVASLAPAQPPPPPPPPPPPLPAPAEPELSPKASRTKSADHSHRCTTCSPTLYFTSSSTLHAHWSRTHALRATIPVPGGQIYKVTRQDGRFFCPSCNKGFESADHFRTHLLATLQCTLAHKWPLPGGIPAGWTLVIDQTPARSSSLGAVPSSSPNVAFQQSPVAMVSPSSVESDSSPPPDTLGLPTSMTTSPVLQTSFVPQASATIVATYLAKADFGLSEQERHLIQRLQSEQQSHAPPGWQATSIRGVVAARRLPASAPIEHGAVRRLLDPILSLPPPNSETLQAHARAMKERVAALARLLTLAPTGISGEGDASEPIMVSCSYSSSTHSAPTEGNEAMEGVENEVPVAIETSIADSARVGPADERTDTAAATGQNTREEECDSPLDWL